MRKYREKRILSILLAAAMISTGLSVPANAAEPEDGFSGAEIYTEEGEFTEDIYGNEAEEEFSEEETETSEETETFEETEIFSEAEVFSEAEETEAFSGADEAGTLFAPEEEDELFSAGDENSGDKEDASLIISSAEDFPVDGIKAGQIYTLANDICLTEGQQISSLQGTLDGKGHVITLADKPLANVVTGTIQNLGVTSAGTISEAYTFGSMAVTLGGTIRNCYSTAILQTDRYLEIGGLVGTMAEGAAIRNSYFAGSISGYFCGGLVGLRKDSSSVLEYSYMTDSSAALEAVPIGGGSFEPYTGKTSDFVKTSLDMKTGIVTRLLNQEIPDTGFYWTNAPEGSQGFPVLTEGMPPVLEQVDWSGFDDLLEKARTLSKDDYLDENWETFTQALEKAVLFRE